MKVGGWWLGESGSGSGCGIGSETVNVTIVEILPEILLDTVVIFWIQTS